MLYTIRASLTLGLLLVMTPIADCNQRAGKPADVERQAQLEQILVNMWELRARGATDKEWSEATEAAIAQFPKEKIDALRAEASRRYPYKQLHLWCIRDRMETMLRTSRTSVSHEERDFENNLRESAKLLEYDSKLPVQKLLYVKDIHYKKEKDPNSITPTPISAGAMVKRDEGPLFYPGVSQIPDYIPRTLTLQVDKETESAKPVLRLTQVEYIQGHWYGWVSKLKEYQNSNAPIEVSNDPAANLLESEEADRITWNLISKSRDASFQMGIVHGQRDCQRLLLDHQKQFGFALAKLECAKSLESLYVPGIKGSTSSSGLIDPQTLPPVNK